jgi:hypothetical protein
MRRIIFLFVFTILGCSERENDFDAFCNFVTALENKEPFTPENRNKTYKNLYDHVKFSITYGTELRTSIFSISNADPAERYSYFTQAAELTLNKKWACPSLERFYTTTIHL